MKSSISIPTVLALMLSVFPAVANERDTGFETTYEAGLGVGNKTRAEVAAETKAAIADRKTGISNHHQTVEAGLGVGNKTRAEVVAETKTAIAERKTGISNHHEIVVSSISSGLSRAEVRGEVVQARKSLIGISEPSL